VIARVVTLLEIQL